MLTTMITIKNRFVMAEGDSLIRPILTFHVALRTRNIHVAPSGKEHFFISLDRANPDFSKELLNQLAERLFPPAMASRKIDFDQFLKVAFKRKILKVLPTLRMRRQLLTHSIVLCLLPKTKTCWCGHSHASIPSTASIHLYPTLQKMSWE